MSIQEQFDSLVDETAKITGINIKYTKNRKYDVVVAKACVINILSNFFGANTVRIGKLMDIHHSTVIHHLKCHGDRHRYEDEYIGKSSIDVHEIITIMRRALSL
jgi:hypothetical protein